MIKLIRREDIAPVRGWRNTSFCKRLILLACLFTAMVAPSRQALAGTVDLLVSGFVSDNVVRYDGVTGELIDEFIPTGSGGLDGTWDSVLGPDGMLYVASSGSDQILRYNGSTGQFIDVFAGPGLGFPIGLTFGPNNDLFVTAAASNHITRFNINDPTDFGPFSFGRDITTPRGITIGPDGDLYVADIVEHDVLRYNGTTGQFVEVFVSPSSGGLTRPGGLIFGPDGNLLVASRDTNNVLRFDGETGAFIDVFAADQSLVHPIGLAFGQDGNLYVSGVETRNVVRFDGTTGNFLDEFLAGPPVIEYTFITFIPKPSTIPTVSQWGMIGMGALLLTAGAFVLRRRTRRGFLRLPGGSNRLSAPA